SVLCGEGSEVEMRDTTPGEDCLPEDWPQAGIAELRLLLARARCLLKLRKGAREPPEPWPNVLLERCTGHQRMIEVRCGPLLGRGRRSGSDKGDRCQGCQFRPERRHG